MKGTIYIFALFFLVGCSPTTKTTSENTLTSFVSISPQAELLDQLTKGIEQVSNRVLVADGQSPHSYEPTARQLAELGNAQLLFSIGVPFEKALIRKIGPLYPDLTLIKTDAGVAKRAMPHAHHGEHCTHDHGEPDPHVWLSPENLINIARTMAEALSEQKPDDRAQIMENLAELEERLSKLDQEIQNKLSPYSGSAFYVFHPSFGYFSDRYNLKQIPIEVDGKSPSPRQLADLIEQAQVDGVKVIFVQKQFPKESAQAIADAIDGQVVQLDPLAKDVIANLEQIAESIALTLN